MSEGHLTAAKNQSGSGGVFLERSFPYVSVLDKTQTPCVVKLIRLWKPFQARPRFGARQKKTPA